MKFLNFLKKNIFRTEVNTEVNISIPMQQSEYWKKFKKKSYNQFIPAIPLEMFYEIAALKIHTLTLFCICWRMHIMVKDLKKWIKFTNPMAKNINLSPNQKSKCLMDLENNNILELKKEIGKTCRFRFKKEFLSKWGVE